MTEVMPSAPTPREQKATLLAAWLAGGQWGVIGWDQLRGCGITRSVASRWRADGKLHVMHRAVFALGHPSVPIEGRLVAAILHAGDGAVLSHRTAAWWWGLIPEAPRVIDVSTPTRARSTSGVRVHHPRHLESTRHRRFPITTVSRTLLDLAARSTFGEVRQALAEADYKGLLDVEEIQAIAGQGRRGSVKLRKALARHLPQLAHTRSKVEQRFLKLCERAGLPLPEMNVRIGRMTVDAVWREQRVAVELDVHDGHGSRAQIERDRRRDLHLRAAGYLVIRYTADQIGNDPDQVVADLLNSLARSA